MSITELSREELAEVINRADEAWSAENVVTTTEAWALSMADAVISAGGEKR